MIRITNGSGATVWTFTWADGKPVSMTNASGTTFYYVTNFRGDVIRIMDGNGTSVASYSYDPWGKVLSVSENSAVAGQPLRYASYVYDTETKLYYLQTRYYDPETARFVSRDNNFGSVDNPLSQNLYQYGFDDPVNFVDVDGKNPVLIRFALSILGRYLVRYSLSFNAAWHIGEKMIKLGIAPIQVINTLRFGQRFYDITEGSDVLWHKGIVVVLRGRQMITVYDGPIK